MICDFLDTFQFVIIIIVNIPSLNGVIWMKGEDWQAQIALDCGALDYIIPMLFSENPVTRRESCWALSNIAAGQSSQVMILIRKSVLSIAMRIVLDDDDDSVRAEATWILSNSELSDDAEVHEFRRCSLLSALRQFS